MRCPIRAKFIVRKTQLSINFKLEFSIIFIVVVYKNNRRVLVDMKDLRNTRGKLSYVRIGGLERSKKTAIISNFL